MKLSIIIPVYNCEDYLRQCLDSVVNQTINDFEILVVNDGSPDNSQIIIDEYVERYPSLVHSYQKENGGLSDARNYGLNYAKGEFIGFLDSDDWLDLEYYEKGINLAEKNDYDIIVYDMIDHYPKHNVHHYSSNFTNKFKMTMSACNKLFRRTLINSSRFPLNLWYEDLNFTSKLLFTTDRIGRVHDSFYHCHCREQSIMTNNNSEKNLDIITVIEDIKKYCKENNLYENNHDILDYMTIDHILITAINRVSKQRNEKKEEVIKTMRTYVVKAVPNLSKRLKELEIPRQRRWIALLNARKLHNLSRFLLTAKALLK